MFGVGSPPQQAAVGVNATGSGNWTLGVFDPATNVSLITTSSGQSGPGRLAVQSDGKLIISFDVITADQTRRSSGTFNEDGRSLSGTSTFRPNSSCAWESNTNATFTAPLFTVQR